MIFIHVLLATTLSCFPHEESLNIIIYNICCISGKMNISVESVADSIPVFHQVQVTDSLLHSHF